MSEGEGSKRENWWAGTVRLWLTNEEDSYRYWRDEARRHRREARRSKNVTETWTVRDEERCTFAEQLKSELEEASPLEEASLYSDLLNAALSEVDWCEVAEAFLEEVAEEEPEPKDDDDQAGEDEV